MHNYARKASVFPAEWLQCWATEPANQMLLILLNNEPISLPASASFSSLQAVILRVY